MGKTGGNPYVGPRNFSWDERKLFFGRETESRKLLALVVTEPLVLFYAQSGAGKSSLINARLIPDLEEKKGLEVLPVGRVSGEFPEKVDNIYAYNLMRSLDPRQGIRNSLANLSLTEFLAGLELQDGEHSYVERPQVGLFERADLPKRPRVLVIDQFEELLSTYPNVWKKREDFLRQLAKAVEDDPYLSVLLVMREDFVPALDPYAQLLPGALRTRFYMQRLERKAALDAVSCPVRDTCPFEEEAAKSLVEDLAQVQAQLPDGTREQYTGPYVEPVQLQVVCYRLWENLPQGHEKITEADLQRAGDVDESLAGYYAEQVAAVAASCALSERDIRDWFAKKLISEDDIRLPVMKEPGASGGLANEAIDALLASHLIRAESRGGATWYELAHDRLVKPVRQDNDKWRQSSLQFFQKQAANWKREDRNESLLLRGRELAGAEQWAGEHPDEVRPGEQEFLEVSREAERLALERRRKRLLGAAIAGSVIGVIVALIAGLSYAEANAQTVLEAAIANCESQVDCDPAGADNDHSYDVMIKEAPESAYLALVNRACRFGLDNNLVNEFKGICRHAVELVPWLATEIGSSSEVTLSLRTTFLERTRISTLARKLGYLADIHKPIGTEDLTLVNQACQNGRQAGLAGELVEPVCEKAVMLAAELADDSANLIPVNQACQDGLVEACNLAAELAADSANLIQVNQACQDGLVEACNRAVTLATVSNDLVQVNQACKDGLVEACHRAVTLAAGSKDLTQVNQACQNGQDMRLEDGLEEVCQQAVTLAATSEDLTQVNQACQNGRQAGLAGELVGPVCEKAVALADNSEDLAQVNQACQNGREAGLAGELVRPVCEKAVELAENSKDLILINQACQDNLNEACVRAVELATGSEDLILVNQACQDNLYEACDRAVELAAASDDLNLVSQACQNGREAGVEQKDLEPVCEKAVELAVGPEAPVEVTRVIEVTVEETRVIEVPVEETRVIEVPVEQTRVIEVPVEETRVTEVPVTRIVTVPVYLLPPTLSPEEGGACTRFNLEMGRDKVRGTRGSGVYVMQEPNGHVVATWQAQDGWLDSGWIEKRPITSDVVHVSVFFYPDAAGPPVAMEIVNPAGGTSYGWLQRGICHAIEIQYPLEN